MAKKVTKDLNRDIHIPVKRFPHGADLNLPKLATVGSAGADLMAAIPKPVILIPGMRVLIPTGIAIQIPIGFEAQIRPRSGLAIKNGITILNSPGTIDSDFRGEINVILANLGQENFNVLHGMRIAQLVIAPVNRPIWNEVQELKNTNRGDGGFGSTGTGT